MSPRAATAAGQLSLPVARLPKLEGSCQMTHKLPSLLVASVMAIVMPAGESCCCSCSWMVAISLVAMVLCVQLGKLQVLPDGRECDPTKLAENVVVA